jgi:hypothetical protein
MDFGVIRKNEPVDSTILRVLQQVGLDACPFCGEYVHVKYEVEPGFEGRNGAITLFRLMIVCDNCPCQFLRRPSLPVFKTEEEAAEAINELAGRWNTRTTVSIVDAIMLQDDGGVI